MTSIILKAARAKAKPLLGVTAVPQFSRVDLELPIRSKSTVELPYKKLSDISDIGIAQPGKGRIYDKKPFKYYLVKGQTYLWCTCGWSKSQPFCDGTHANELMRIKLKPVYFRPPETGYYWLCNCKQTSQRPFCDGTHRNEDIQAAIK